MAFNIFRIDWSKRKKALDKAARTASKLAREFRSKTKEAQKLAYEMEDQLRKAKVSSSKSKSSKTLQKGKTPSSEGTQSFANIMPWVLFAAGAAVIWAITGLWWVAAMALVFAALIKLTMFRDKPKIGKLENITLADKRKAERFVRHLNRFASVASSAITFFDKIGWKVEKIKKYYELAKDLKDKKDRLEDKISARRKLIKKKKKLKKDKSKREWKAIKQEAELLEIQKEELEDELSDVKRAWKDSRKDFKRLKRNFKKENEIVSDKIDDIRGEIKKFRKHVKWLSNQPRLKSFAKSFYGRKTKKRLKELSKQMSKFS